MKPEDYELTKKQLIENVIPGAGHLVILGAGASRSISEKNAGDRNGKKIPVMEEIVEELGLAKIFREAGYRGDLKNFEGAYSDICNRSMSREINKINFILADYFSQLKIPEDLTYYDYLLGGLRPRDLIATFNWDPLLSQAYSRLIKVGLGKWLPKILHLHGNVSIGYCKKDKTAGPLYSVCRICRKTYTPTPLLYPVKEKNYQDNEFIKAQWTTISQYMKFARVVTIYGYSAPKTDIEAKNLLLTGWGSWEKRQFEQFEIIIKPGGDEQDARVAWDDFIHTHHYRIRHDFMDSYIAQTPRRTIESWWAQNFEAKFVENNSYPKLTSVSDLAEWLQPLIKAEVRNE